MLPSFKSEIILVVYGHDPGSNNRSRIGNAIEMAGKLVIYNFSLFEDSGEELVY